MKRGILKGKVILPDPGYRLFGYSSITLNGRTYRFEGYKTSILKFLIDNGSDTFKAGSIAKDEYGTIVDMSLRIRGGTVGKTASKVIIETIQEGTLGFATGVSPALSELGNVINGISTFQIVDNVTGGTERLANTGVKRPTGVQSFIDHRFGKRIIIEICSFMPDRQINKFYNKVVNTKSTEISFSNVAAVVKGMP